MADNMHEKALTLKERIQKLSSLPSISIVKYHLVKTLNNDSASVEDISDIIKHDPAITSRVMAIANSAFFGCPGRIGSIDQAVMLLGFDLVRSISLASSMFSMFAGQGGNLKRIWAHSYAVGSLAGALCKKTRCADWSGSFLSGLLHDIGRLVIFKIAIDGDMEGQAHGLSGLRGDGLVKAETAMLGCDHSVAAKWFLESLCFPEEVIRPIETHHTAGAISPADGISRIIYLAEGLLLQICPDLDNDGEWTEDHDRFFHEMGLSENDKDELRAGAEKDRASITEFFDL
jgi:putative nucleotidyltransferase with HDIG domain